MCSSADYGCDHFENESVSPEGWRQWLSSQALPKEWWKHHHRDCGTKYRGCHPDKCPKNQYEKTGIWKLKWD